MKIGLGLPVDDPSLLLEWGRRADAGPFSTLGLLDRLVWHNPEPLIALAAVAGSTTRIRLQTEVLLAPLRSTALLAKQVATLDRLSGGRFVLGLGVGGRADDDAAAGVPASGRGARLDRQLLEMRRIWAGEAHGDQPGAIGPATTRPDGPELLFGAFREAALARVARFGGGFLCAAAPSWAGGLIRTVDRQWADAGRPGRPRHVAQVNVAVGGDAIADEARAALHGYYSFTGEPERMVAGLVTDAGRLRDTVRAFDDLGVGEVVLYCWATGTDQIDRLADLDL